MGGNAAYFSTLPVREMADEIKAVGVPSMDIEDVVRGLSAAIECMAIMKNDT